MQANGPIARGANTPPVHFVYHVPKCAGRTIERHLANALPPGAHLRLRRRRGLGRLVTGYDVSRLQDLEETRVVSGHHLGMSFDGLFQNRLIKRSLLLRDPASHFVSYYNYRMTRYINEGLQPYGVGLAYGAMRRNFVTHYILNNFLELNWVQIASLSDQDKYDLANAFLSMFWFVGDYTLCDELLMALGDRLDVAPNAPRRNCVTDLAHSTGWTPLTLDVLSKSAVAKIQDENRIDARLWETWREARHETATVRPIALKTGTSSFLSNEALRFVHQIARRLQRRWGYFDAGKTAPQQNSASLA
ncbi:MAG: hypothetical protein QNJ62_10085 [Methyloceanibacter sp.]|nr:hypothetical protein [Methyloceanibacter sp.]